LSHIGSHDPGAMAKSKGEYVAFLTAVSLWCRQVEAAHDVSLAPSSPLKTPASGGGGSMGSLSQAAVGDKRKR
jgi:hypothetical protein